MDEVPEDEEVLAYRSVPDTESMVRDTSGNLTREQIADQRRRITYSFMSRAIRDALQMPDLARNRRRFDPHNLQSQNGRPR